MLGCPSASSLIFRRLAYAETVPNANRKATYHHHHLRHWIHLDLTVIVFEGACWRSIVAFLSRSKGCWKMVIREGARVAFARLEVVKAYCLKGCIIVMWDSKCLIKAEGHIDSQVARKLRCCKKILRCSDCYWSYQALDPAGLYRWRLLVLFDGVVVELCVGLGLRTDLRNVFMPRTP